MLCGISFENVKRVSRALQWTQSCNLHIKFRFHFAFWDSTFCWKFCADQTDHIIHSWLNLSSQRWKHEIRGPYTVTWALTSKEWNLIGPVRFQRKRKTKMVFVPVSARIFVPKLLESNIWVLCLVHWVFQNGSYCDCINGKRGYHNASTTGTMYYSTSFFIVVISNLVDYRECLIFNMTDGNSK